MSKSTDLSCLLAEALLGNKGERVPCICPGGMMNMITSDGCLFIFLAESARGCRDDGKAGRISVQE